MSEVPLVEQMRHISHIPLAEETSHQNKPHDDLCISVSISRVQGPTHSQSVTTEASQ